MKKSIYKSALMCGDFPSGRLAIIQARLVKLESVPERVFLAHRRYRLWRITDAESGIAVSSFGDETETLRETLKLTNERVRNFLNGGGNFAGLVYKRLTEFGYIPLFTNVKRFSSKVA